MVRRSRANGELTRWRHPVACAARDAFMRLTFDRLVYRETYRLTMATGFTGFTGFTGSTGFSGSTGLTGDRSEK